MLQFSGAIETITISKGIAEAAGDADMQRHTSELSELLVDFFNLFHAWEEEAVKSLKTKLSILEVHAIEALGRRPGSKMRELSEILEISTPSVTAVIDKLETKGFARRKTTPSDRRVFLLELTKKGKDLFDKHSEQHQKMAGKVLSFISEHDIPMFVEAFKNIVDKSQK
jgi:DNA-binding MarR family transcriptional regulator